MITRGLRSYLDRDWAAVREAKFLDRARLVDVGGVEVPVKQVLPSKAKRSGATDLSGLP